MSEENENQEAAQEVLDQDTSASGSSDEAEILKAENKQLQDRLAKLEEECQELKKEDKYRMAEFDNFRRRTRAEQEELRKTAAKALLLELLDIEDGFANAIDGSETADFAAWKEGVLMIVKKFRSLLEKYGVQPIDALGSEFDPGLHEALFVVDEGEHEGQQVVQVMQRGYLLNDKVLRLAKVKVARGQGTSEATKSEG